MTSSLKNATRILIDLGGGDSSASARLLPIVYDELHRLAVSYMRRQSPNHTLQPTALVHEAYLKLVDQTRVGEQDRTHFMAVAATAMRQVLIDHANKRQAAKRGQGWQRITLDESVTPPVEREIDLSALEQALSKLSRLHERQCRVVELRFFAGLTIKHTAQALGVGRSMVEDDWRLAKAWLALELRGQGDP